MAARSDVGPAARAAMNAMKSAKQRRWVTKAQRNRRKAEGSRAAKKQEQTLRPFLTVPVNEQLLAPNNSYGAPDFVTRGFYVDRPFRCKDCGKDQVWTATQQKWWYEVAKDLPGPPRFVAVPAGARNRSGRPMPGKSIWKGPRGKELDCCDRVRRRVLHSD